LAAYVVPSNGAVSAGELKEHLKGTLPEYMLPSAIVSLKGMPLTANGKVDRQALPAPEELAEEQEHVGPRNAVEEVLAGIWEEVLGRDEVSVTDGFFELGGHSLLATQVISRVREAFEVEVPLRAIFEAPSVAALAGRIAELQRAGEGLARPPLRRVSRDGDLPLSFSQQRLWFIDQLEPGSSLYNVPRVMRLRGPLDRPALER